MIRGMFSSIMVALIAILSGFNNTQAQTSGTLTFTISPVSHSGSYGAKHVVAVWIENASGTFIKTKLKYSSSKNYDHLGTWTSKSSQNTVDATSGATLTSYNPLSFSWDGTNVSNTNVADGEYKIWIELAWDKSLTSGKTVTSYSFTKGTNVSHLTPANTSLFTDVTIDWVPLSTGIKSTNLSKEIRVFPNPTTGLVYIEMKSIEAECNVQVVNIAGAILFEDHVSKGASANKSIDLSNYSDGVYLVNILFPNHADDMQYKVMLDKSR
jgi:hypothetical protein